MTDATPGSIGAGDAATIDIDKRMTQRDRMRRVTEDILVGIRWIEVYATGLIVAFKEQQEMILK
jgi:hypothetical protein